MAAPGARAPPPTCWNCGEAGHRSSDCGAPSTNNKFKPAAAGSRGAGRKKRRNSSKRRNSGACYECGLRGHYKDGCLCLEKNKDKRPPGWDFPPGYTPHSAAPSRRCGDDGGGGTSAAEADTGRRPGPGAGSDGDPSAASAASILEATKKAWLEEQREIASRVVVLPDDDDADDDDHGEDSSSPLSSTVLREGGRFSLVQAATDRISSGGSDGDDGGEGGRGGGVPTTASPGSSSSSPSRHRLLFGGVDVSFPDDDKKDPAVAVYVVVDGHTKDVVYEDHEYYHLKVPYIASFLAFREIDPIVRLVEKQVRDKPNLTPAAILVDGNGVLHPRGAGIATFVGVRTGIPSIGVGKTLHCVGGLTRELLSAGLDESFRDAAAEIASEESSLISKPFATRDAVLFDSKPICGGSVKHEGSGDDSSSSNLQSEIGKSDDKSNELSPASAERGGRVDRVACLKAIAPACHGLAVPLVVPRRSCCPATSAGDEKEGGGAVPHRDDDHHHLCGGGVKTLGYALVGHGGKVRGAAAATRITTTQEKAALGSRNPIYVSVGHDVSLRAATAICASLCVARIPEPVRQADLKGRGLLRKKQKQQQKLQR